MSVVLWYTKIGVKRTSERFPAMAKIDQVPRCEIPAFFEINAHRLDLRIRTVVLKHDDRRTVGRRRPEISEHIVGRCGDNCAV